MAPYNKILDPTTYSPENVNKAVSSAVNTGTGANMSTQPQMSVNPVNMSVQPNTPAIPVAPVTPKTPPTTVNQAKPYVQSVTVTPDIQAEMDKWGITAEAAAGNLAMQQAKGGVTTSEPASTYFTQLMQENTADADRIETGKQAISDAELIKMQDEARAGGLKVPESTKKPSSTTIYDEIPEVAASNAEYDAMIKATEDYMAKADIRNQQAVQRIRDTYSALREEQKVSNQNYLKATEILGTRSGRQRYAPEIQGGLLSAESKAGFKRLQDLQSEEEQLIQQAQAAYEASQFEALQEIFSLKTAKRKEQAEILANMQEQALSKEEASIKKMQAEREQKKDLIADLDFFAKGGMTLDDESGAYIDSMLGYGKGASQAYVEAQRATNEVDKMGKMFDFLGKVPSDQTVTMPDGSKVSGLKEVDYTKGIFRTTETDLYGNVSDVFAKYNPSTGQVEFLNQIDYGNIGKSSGPTSWQEYQLVGGENSGQSYSEFLKGTTGTGDLSDKDVTNIDKSPQAKKISTLTDLLSKAQTYKALVEAHGTELFGKNAAAIDSAFATLKVAWKEAANLNSTGAVLLRQAQ